MKKIVIFGVGSTGEVAHYYFTRDAGREIAGFTVDAAFLTSPRFCGLPVVPFDQVESAFSPGEHDLFVAVGYSQSNQVRAGKVEEAKAKGYALASYRSSHATVLTDEPLGENSCVIEGAVIQPFARIGRNVTIWGGVIGHHAVIGDHCFIAGLVGGGVQVGPNCLVGISAILTSYITVGEKSVIGAGAIVTKDLPPSSLLRGAAPEWAPTRQNHRQRLE